MALWCLKTTSMTRILNSLKTYVSFSVTWSRPTTKTGKGSLTILQGSTTLPPTLYSRLLLSANGSALTAVSKPSFMSDVIIQESGHLCFTSRQQNVSVQGNFTLQVKI